MKDIVCEVLVALSWDDRALRAFNASLRSYERAGSPGIPMGERNYKVKFARDRRKNRKRK